MYCTNFAYNSLLYLLFSFRTFVRVCWLGPVRFFYFLCVYNCHCCRLFHSPIQCAAICALFICTAARPVAVVAATVTVAAFFAHIFLFASHIRHIFIVLCVAVCLCPVDHFVCATIDLGQSDRITCTHEQSWWKNKTASEWAARATHVWAFAVSKILINLTTPAHKWQIKKQKPVPIPGNNRQTFCLQKSRENISERTGKKVLELER